MSKANEQNSANKGNEQNTDANIKDLLNKITQQGDKIRALKSGNVTRYHVILENNIFEIALNNLVV